MIKVAVVAPILVNYDAISLAAINSFQMIDALPGFSASIITGNNQCKDERAQLAEGPYQLLCNSDFRHADVIMYHFGIYAPVHDAMLIGNGHGKQIVIYHNVTPAKFLPAESKPVIDRSIWQMANFLNADAIWAVSRANAESLREHSIDHPDVQVLPLVVAGPDRHYLTEKPVRPVDILYLGRMVESKGLMDLVEALIKVRQNSDLEFKLRLIGNEAFSDSRYVEATKQRAKILGDRIEFLGEVSQQSRDLLLREAHILAIPSFHEGFCKPVVEALRSGCIPVGYSSYNIPNVCGGLGKLAEPGDVDALSDALLSVIESLSNADNHDPDTQLPLDRGETSMSEFNELVDSHVAQFETGEVSRQIENSLRTLLGPTDLIL